MNIDEAITITQNNLLLQYENDIDAENTFKDFKKINDLLSPLKKNIDEIIIITQKNFLLKNEKNILKDFEKINDLLINIKKNDDTDAFNYAIILALIVLLFFFLIYK